MRRDYTRCEGTRTGIRIAVHGRYLILFRADDESVRIERIVHGARYRPSRS